MEAGDGEMVKAREGVGALPRLANPQSCISWAFRVPTQRLKELITCRKDKKKNSLKVFTSIIFD